MSFYINSEIVYDYIDFDGELVNVLKVLCANGTTKIKQQLAKLIKPSESKQPDYKILQRDMKAYGQKELIYDVYCDRVNFIGIDSFRAYVVFFNNRNIIFNRDRGGYSIDIKDAKRIGLPLEFSTYKLLPDSRKKPIVMDDTKVTLLDDLLGKPKFVAKTIKFEGTKLEFLVNSNSELNQHAAKAIQELANDLVYFLNEGWDREAAKNEVFSKSAHSTSEVKELVLEAVTRVA